LKWRRDWFEWEKPIVEEFLKLIQGCIMRIDAHDQLVWAGVIHGEYKVREAYNTLVKAVGGKNNEVFEKLWRSKGLPTAQLCAWRVLHSRVTTQDMLHNRGIPINNFNCIFCNSCEETVNHVFFSCKKTSSIWKLCDKWVGVQNVHHNEAHSHYLGFKLAGLGGKHNGVWRMVWMSIIWNIWKHKNDTIFKKIRSVTC